jgi:WD40 repeat protein
MQFLDLTSGKITGSMAVGHSKLENMLYDSNTGILALASADKRISLINTNDFQAKPLVIEEHSLGNSKVKAMSFNNKGVLFVLTDDNKLRFWDTDVNTYANTLSAMKLAPLSNTEWNWILGSNFSEK